MTMIKINLNKKQKGVISKTEKKNIVLYIIIPIIIAGVAIFLMQYSIETKISSVNGNIKIYNSRISVLLPRVRMVNAIKRQQNLIMQKISVINTLKKEQIGPIGYIYYVTVTIPRFAWINSLKSSNGNITVNGVALDGQVVSLFMDNLNKTGFFHNVTLIQTSEIKKQDLKLQNFRLTFQNEREVTKKRIMKSH